MKRLSTQSILFIVLVAAILSTAPGCALNRPYPEKASYMPDLTFKEAKAINKLPFRIKIRNTRVSAPFEGKSFVYRLPANQWESDFYNEWFAYPRDLITESCISALTQSGRFASVTSEDSLIEADFYLEGTLVESYLDRRNLNHPKSVLKIRWALIGHLSPIKPSKEAIWSKTYEANQEVPSNQLQEYVESTTQGLTEILDQLSSDLGKHLSKDM